MGCPVQGQGCRMLDDNVWPPKPTLLDPLTEYDALIKSKLHTLSEAEPGPSRLRLMEALRDEEGMDLRQARRLANSYCDRHGVFVITRATQIFTWGNFGLVLAVGLLLLLNVSLSWRRDAILGIPHTHAALLVFRGRQLAISYASFLLLFLNLIVLGLRVRRSRSATG